MSPISLPLAFSSLNRVEIVSTCLGGSSSDQLLTISELMGVFIGMNLHCEELAESSPFDRLKPSWCNTLLGQPL